MDVKDPQNPVHFALNSSIPTELDKTKVNYGLAQAIADGPSTQNLGVTEDIIEPGVAPASFPSGSPISPFDKNGQPAPIVFKTSPAGDATKVPNIQATPGSSTNVGVLHPPPPRPVDIQPIPPPIYINSGVQHLGKGP